MSDQQSTGGTRLKVVVLVRFLMDIAAFMLVDGNGRILGVPSAPSLVLGRLSTARLRPALGTLDIGHETIGSGGRSCSRQ